MGFSCSNTAPTLKPEASHSTINILLKSGKLNTGVEVVASFRLWNAFSDYELQSKEFFFNILVSGAAIFP